MNECGRIVEECWRWLADQYGHVLLDEYVVMPNHLHGIIVLGASDGDGIMSSQRRSLGQLVAAFKAKSTSRLQEILGAPGSIWQRNYYERVIRDGAELARTRLYIAENPAAWTEDAENPRRLV